MFKRTASSVGLMVLAASIYAFSTTPAIGEIISFGSGWGLPGAIQFETPIGSPFPGQGGSPIEDTFFEMEGQAGVSKFHPDWGTLNSVSLSVAGFGLYTYDYSPEIPETLPGGLAQGADFTVEVSISQDDIGMYQMDTETGMNPGLVGTLIPEVEFSGSVSNSPFIGFGLFNVDVYHQLSGNIFVDMGSGGPLPGWEGAMSGVFGGTITVIYNYTPAGSSTGGPLPGDGDLDGFVGISDLNLVLGNWNQNVAGWNNGDFDNDGFIGIIDLNYVLSNWNAGTPPILNLASVPEPSTALLIFFISLAGCSRRIWVPK